MRSIAFSTVCFVAGLALEASPARALPDLVPEIFGANLGIGNVDSVGAIRYRDRERTPDGLQQMTLVPGAANRATINVRGGGANLGLPPLDLSLPVTVRMRRDDGSPICWQSTYGSATQRTPIKFHAKSN